MCGSKTWTLDVVLEASIHENLQLHGDLEQVGTYTVSTVVWQKLTAF